MNYAVVVCCLIAALILTLLNIKTLASNENNTLKIIASIAATFISLRYVAMIAYSVLDDYMMLNTLKYFYFASDIGLPILVISALWYITPAYRDKIPYNKFIFISVPWVAYFLFITFMQPTSIVAGKYFGYQLRIADEFIMITNAMQISFIVVVALLAMNGILRYKHLQIRTQLILILISQLLVAVDVYTFNGINHYIFMPFTLTDVCVLVATYYAFATQIRMIKSSNVSVRE